MCGSCGAAGPMVSYEAGDYVSFTYPQKGVPESAYGKVMSLDNQWGVEVKILSEGAEMNGGCIGGDIVWVDWPPFSCIKEFPGFRIVRIDPSVISASESKNEEAQTFTIGHGWLQEPFILKAQDGKN